MVLGAFAHLLGLEPDPEVVASATDGPSALAAARRLDPDVLLTDVEMPGTSGLDVAAALAGSRTRVVVVTTFARSGYLRRALDAGVAGYVLKDAPIEQLAGVVRRVHAGERSPRASATCCAWAATACPTPRSRPACTWPRGPSATTSPRR